MKKLLALLLCTLLLMTGLVHASAETTTITWWTWSTEATTAYQKIVSDFEAQNPDIKVDLQFIANADYWTKMPVAIVSGTGPDIFQMTRPSFELYAASNQAYDLTDVIAGSEKLQANLAEMDPTLVESYKFNGAQMAIPYTVECSTIAYNKELLREAGIQDLKEIEDTWTWDDLREIANKLTKKDASGNTVQYGFLIEAGRMPQWELIWSRGVEMFNEAKDECKIADPEIIDVTQILVDMYQEGVSPTVQDTATMSADDMFMSGKLAMVTAGSWKVPTYAGITAFEWDVAELPRDAKSGERKSSSNVLGFVINPRSKKIDATVKFLEFASSHEGQAILADTHTYIPANISVRDSFFDSNIPENLHAYLRALDYVHPNTLTQFIPYSQFTQEFSDAYRAAYAGDMTLEQALTEHQNNINAIMEENKANFE